MNDATIHFTGVFSSSQIETTLSDAPRPLPFEITPMIESAWTQALARLGPRLYDGPMMRLNSWKIESGRLLLTLGRTSYKPFMGTNLTHPELADRYGSDVLANPLGLSAALESADGFLLFGRRNSNVACYPNRVHPFAGTLDQPNVFGGIQRELEEELGLSLPDIADLRIIGLAEDRSIRQPELIFRAKSNRTRQEIERLLDAAEHTEVVAIRFDDVENAMQRADLTPIARATLTLWRDSP